MQNPLLNADSGPTRQDFLVLRDEFREFTRRESPISVRLIHTPSNASEERMATIPSVHSLPLTHYFSAGVYGYTPLRGASGEVTLVDPSDWDPNGTSNLDFRGNVQIDRELAAWRRIEYYGDFPAAERLRGIVCEGVAKNFDRSILVRELLRGWVFERRDLEGMWWALLFEMAWAKRDARISADKFLWTSDSRGRSATLRVSDERMQQIWQAELQAHESPNAKRGMSSPPGAYFSQIEDAVRASCHLAELLAYEAAPARLAALPASNEASGSTFAKSGDVWQLRYSAKDGTPEVASFPDRLGFEHIYRLIYRPELLAKEFSAPERSHGRTDKKTLAAAREKLRDLDARRAHASPIEIPDIDAETKKIQGYLDENTRPGGEIKSFSTERERSINRFRNAVNDALTYSQTRAPLWAAHMKSAINFTATPHPAYEPLDAMNWT